MSERFGGPCCAHSRVSWRTKQIEGGLTTGWWECDSGCGMRFTTVPHAMSIQQEPAESRAVPPPIEGANMLTVEDIDQIVDGIENFIMGDGEIDELWQPYVDKLNALKAETRSVPPTTAGGNETIIDEDGIYQSRPPRPFAALRAKMSSESQVRAAARTEEMLSEMRTAETRAVIPEPPATNER